LTVTKEGPAFGWIQVFTPGVDGQEFIQDTYLPFMERYGLQAADSIARQQGRPPDGSIFERTADSTVAGIKVAGIRLNTAALFPREDQKTAGFLGGIKAGIEMRIASMDDLMLITSDDARMESLIHKAQNLQSAPAQGPMFRFEMDLDAVTQGLGLAPPPENAAAGESGFGKYIVTSEMRNGTLTVRTTLPISGLSRLGEAIKAMSAAKEGSGAGQ
ncbi:MAG: hypothetical protein P8X90_31570, partial [Desulfobacterales bacterium]